MSKTANKRKKNLVDFPCGNIEVHNYLNPKIYNQENETHCGCFFVVAKKHPESVI